MIHQQVWSGPQYREIWSLQGATSLGVVGVRVAVEEVFGGQGLDSGEISFQQLSLGPSETAGVLPITADVAIPTMQNANNNEF